jgi:hypothetical protein
MLSALELPPQYACVQFWIIVFTFVILLTTVGLSIYRGLRRRRAAQLEAWFIENPLDLPRERYVETLRVPRDENLILYHVLKTTDDREFSNVSAIVKYPDEIDIRFYDKTYRDALRYGRKVVSRGEHEAVVQFGGLVFVKDQIDKLPFPLVLDTSRARGLYEVTVTIAFTGARKHVQKHLNLDVCESDFSYDRSLFSLGNSRFKMP